MPKKVTFNAPLATVLPSPVSPGFVVKIDQLVRLFFQFLGTPFANAAAMQLKANWDTLIAASNSTKVVYTPLFSNPEIAPSKALESSSDSNLTFSGIGEYFGEGTAKFKGEFRGKDTASMDSLSALTELTLMNAAGLSNVGVYMCNKDGDFFCNADFSPIRIYNFSLRSRGTKGLNSADVIEFTFELQPNWDTAIVPVKTAVAGGFDPLLYP